MEKKLSRRKFLGGAATAAAGTATMSGEAAARYIGQPVYTTDYIYIYDGPGVENNFVRTCNANTGLEIQDGPVDEDGYRWWKYYVNGDSDDPTRVEGWGIQNYTTPANFSYPTWGYIVSTYYDDRPQLGRDHWSMDIAHDYGIRIRASYDGTVNFTGWGDSYGYWIQINHGGGYETRYAHLNDIYVSDGQSVNRNDVIGTMGCSGIHCNSQADGGWGPHLHFEILHNDYKQNWGMTKNTHCWWGGGIERTWW